MKSLCLPFDNRSPFGFRICHPILTLCRYSMVIPLRISLLLRFLDNIYSFIYMYICLFSNSIGWQDKLSVFINYIYIIYNSVSPEANIVFISQGGEESGSNSEDSSSSNSSGNNPGNDPDDNGPNSDSNDNQPNHDDDKDNDPNDTDDYDNDNDDNKSDATIKTLDTSDTHDVLLWTAALVEGGLEGDIDAIETAKEQFPDCFVGRSEREGLLKVSEVIEEDIKAYRDEQKAKQAFIDDDNQSESEESSNIEDKSESEETVNKELKRKREDESSNDEPENKRYKSKNNDDSDNDDSDNNDSDNSGSSGLGGSGDNGNPPSENSMGSSENSKSWIDIGIFLLMFFSSIADSITLFFENLI